MNIQYVRAQQAARLRSRHHRHGALTRRQFLQAGLATLAAGAAGLGRAGAAWAAPSMKSTADPRPIPYGSPFLYPDPTIFHADAPGYPLPDPPFPTNPATSNPATITDFNGAVGLMYVGGHGTHHDLVSGQTSTLTWEVDMRFMVGEYIGQDGGQHNGTFCLI
jgi:hypothetical protein